MSVGRICQRDVDLANLDESVWQAAERMHQRGVGTLVIVNESKQPIGIVTDRDLVVGAIAVDKDPHTTLIEEVMTRQPHTIAENASIESALAMMRSAACRRIPVVNEQDKLVGLLSMDDVLMLLSEEFVQIGTLLEKQTPRATAEV